MKEKKDKTEKIRKEDTTREKKAQDKTKIKSRSGEDKAQDKSKIKSRSGEDKAQSKAAKSNSDEGKGRRLFRGRKGTGDVKPGKDKLPKAGNDKAGTGKARADKARMPKKPAEKLQIIPLGGLEKIGMNITAIRYGDSIIVIDCGISFPEDEMLGIDKVIPDVSYLIDHKEMVKGYFITHGHEDHIGAISYILPQVNAPVYCTKLTMGLIEHKMEEAGNIELLRRNVQKQGSVVKLGDISVEFIKTNHSIPGASSLAIQTPAGTIFHTGDFKVDYTPLFGESIDLQRIAAIGKEGVLALLSDSTNAMRPGFTPSETKVAATMDALFAENKDHRIIVGTFSSNLDRVQQLMIIARKYNRKVVLQGRSMEQTIDIAVELGCVKIPKGIMIDVDEMHNYPDNRLVIISTGSQGESMAALSRMANSTHKKVTIKPGDVIIFSSNPIPGNEKAVSRVMNELAKQGAKVIYQDTHVSGHACQQDLELIYSLLKPKYAIPVHGEYRHRAANADLALALGIPKENIFLLQSGDVLELSGKEAKVVDKVTAREIYVDGLGVGDVGSAVIRDRQALAEAGIIMVALTIDGASGDFIAGPEIITRGVIYVKESGDVMAELQRVVMNSLVNCEDRKIRDYSKMKTIIRTDLEDYLWERFQRSPVILPVIMEARQ